MSASYMLYEQASIVLAQGYQPPNFDLTPSPEFQDTARKAAFFFALVWIVYTLVQFAMPSRKNNMMGRNQGQAGRMLAAGLVIVMLLDLSSVNVVVHFTLRIFHEAASVVGLT